jgi:hypothetical protein
MVSVPASVSAVDPQQTAVKSAFSNYVCVIAITVALHISILRDYRFRFKCLRLCLPISLNRFQFSVFLMVSRQMVNECASLMLAAQMALKVPVTIKTQQHPFLVLRLLAPPRVRIMSVPNRPTYPVHLHSSNPLLCPLLEQLLPAVMTSMSGWLISPTQVYRDNNSLFPLLEHPSLHLTFPKTLFL